MSTMSIAQLAQQAGVAIDAVRYYERNALPKPAGRLASGYRRYGVTELKRLQFIRRAKALGFSRDDVRELLTLSDERDIAKVRHAATRRLGEIEQRIAEFECVRVRLHALIADCPGHGRAAACPILNAPSQGDSV